ncbi:MAG: binding-protein-dependent transport system inner rane component [Deltaproteobacteria bacterium]|nr:binding-protein-dependent transport system inner rane component [Deltaproteobacteria bacterium]
MKTYIIKRLLQAIGVCLVISMISFFLLFLNTAPALVLLPPEAEVTDIAVFKKQMGLDRPVTIQYLDFLGRVVLHGDFGNSFAAKVPALQLVGERLPATIQLALAALLVVNIVAIPVGVISAIRRYSLTDNIATFIALIGQAMPLYWLGIMLIIIFGIWLRWFPISGSDTLSHLVLPAVTLGSWILPINMRLVRSGMLEVLSQDYIRTARAKGLAERKVLVKHAFKNAAIPVVTVLGMQLGLLLGGAVVTETVFAWPGLGRLAVDSIRMGDYPVVQAIVVVFAFFVVIGNLLADILAALIDPRIRLD